MSDSLLLVGGTLFCFVVYLLCLWVGRNNGEVRTRPDPTTDCPVPLEMER